MTGEPWCDHGHDDQLCWSPSLMTSEPCDHGHNDQARSFQSKHHVHQLWWSPSSMTGEPRQCHCPTNCIWVGPKGRNSLDTRSESQLWPKNQPALVNKIVGNSLKKVWLGHLMLAPAPLPSTNSINPIWLWWSQLKQDETNEVNCKHKDLSKINSSDTALSREINWALFLFYKIKVVAPYG